MKDWNDIKSHDSWEILRLWENLLKDLKDFKLDHVYQFLVQLEQILKSIL